MNYLVVKVTQYVLQPLPAIVMPSVSPLRPTSLPPAGLRPAGDPFRRATQDTAEPRVRIHVVNQAEGPASTAVATGAKLSTLEIDLVTHISGFLRPRDIGRLALVSRDAHRAAYSDPANKAVRDAAAQCDAHPNIDNADALAAADAHRLGLQPSTITDAEEAVHQLRAECNTLMERLNHDRINFGRVKKLCLRLEQHRRVMESRGWDSETLLRQIFTEHLGPWSKTNIATALTRSLAPIMNNDGVGQPTRYILGLIFEVAQASASDSGARATRALADTLITSARSARRETTPSEGQQTWQPRLVLACRTVNQVCAPNPMPHDMAQAQRYCRSLFLQMNVHDVAYLRNFLDAFMEDAPRDAPSTQLISMILDLANVVVPFRPEQRSLMAESVLAALERGDVTLGLLGEVHSGFDIASALRDALLKRSRQEVNALGMAWSRMQRACAMSEWIEDQLDLVMDHQPSIDRAFEEAEMIAYAALQDGPAEADRSGDDDREEELASESDSNDYDGVHSRPELWNSIANQIAQPQDPAQPPVAGASQESTEAKQPKRSSSD